MTFITAYQAKERTIEYHKDEKEKSIKRAESLKIKEKDNNKTEINKPLMLEIYRIIEKSSLLGKTSADIFHVLNRDDIDNVVKHLTENGYIVLEYNQEINISWLKA